jgi:hypothetical protein
VTGSDLARRRLLQVGLIAPIVLTLLAVVVQLAVLPALPDPVAIHWGSDGQPDGFGPRWSFPLLTLVIGVGVPALTVGAGLGASSVDPRARAAGSNMRFLGAVSLGTSAFFGTLSTGLVLAQGGLEDAVAAPSVWVPGVAGLVAAAIAGVVGWFAQPKPPLAGAPSEPAEPLPLAADERAVWMRSGTMSPVAAALLIAAAALLVAWGVWLVATQADASAWIVFGVGLAVSMVVATGVAYRVIVDDSGLRVRGALGLPRFHVPLADVQAAETVVVNPPAEFGGWGWRWAPGRFGVVLRAGEALQVVKADGRRFVVTIDDAATGAALLQSLALRAQAAGR